MELYHYDLYRLNPGDDLTSIGYEESIIDENAINVVEWADRIIEKYPEKRIEVHLKTEDFFHKISIRFFDNQIVEEDSVEGYYEEWSTPMHVREHCKQVANVAMQIANAFISAGEVLNINLINTAALLHDVSRLCDFKTFEKSQFNEPITERKWAKWKSLRNLYKSVHHADISSDFFKDLGFVKTAEVIRTHKSAIITEEPEALDTLEKKIVFYADKRCKHNEIVDLTERFRDGAERYAQFNDTKKKKLFQEVEMLTFNLEKELFSLIDIGPEDIK